MAKYIFRLDDICPEMDWEKFERLVQIFEKYNVKPLLAVIPDNQDESLKIGKPNPNFWERIKELSKKGFTIGMHGYQHKLENKNGGLLKISPGSEFATLPYEIQFNKIKKGKEILEKNGIKTDIFVAPWHSFDKNTIRALKELGFRYISDGIALWPFEKYGMIWIPQIAWKPRKFPIGIITFCLHSNFMTEKDFSHLENFLKHEASNTIDFEKMIKWYKTKSIISNLIINCINPLFEKVYCIFMRYIFRRK